MRRLACIILFGALMALTLVARDDFTGGYDADIAGRVPDGGGGTWAIHPQWSPGNSFFDILGGALVSRGAGNFAVYTLGSTHDAVESVVIYPSGSSIGLCTPDGLEGTSTPPYTNSGTNPDTGGHWHYPNPESSWTVWFLRPPNSTSITAQTTYSYSSYFDTTFSQTIPAGTAFIKWYYEKDGSGVSRVYYDFTLPLDNPYSMFNVSHHLLGTAPGQFGENAGCNFLGFATFTDAFGGQFAAHANNMRLGAGGNIGNVTSMATPTYSASGVTVSGSYPSVPTPDSIATHTLHVRHNPTIRENYSARVQFFHIAGVKKFLIALQSQDSTGTVKTLKNNASAPALTAAFDTSYTWLLERTSDNILILSLDGVEKLRFDIINDTVQSSPFGSAPLYTTGVPALGAFGTTSTEQRITRFSVYVDVPCVPGGGEGGGDPGSEGTIQSFLWTRKNLLHRRVVAPSESSEAVKFRANLAFRTARRGWIRDNIGWQNLSTETTFVLDPTDHPDTPGLPCEGVVDPFPDPTPVTDKAFGLYNLTRNLLDVYPPFNGAITGSSAAALPALLAAIAARGFQLWFVPAFRSEQTENHSGRGRYDHTATMAKFASFSPFSDPNSGVIPFCVPYDEADCGLCWQGKPPTEAEVEAGCGLVTSIFGVPCAVRMSPRKLLSLGWSCTNIRIGMAQWGGPGGFGVEGFGNDYPGYIAAQISAATTLGLDGILWGLNPYRDLASGWRTSIWTDAFLQSIGTQAAAAGMNYGVYMWLGYPPSTRVLLPGTNAALQTISAAL